MASAIELDRVSKVYDGGVEALHQVSLEVPDGELLVLVGPSGCGKTTLLRLIAGLEEVTSGTVRLDGQDATRAEPGDRSVSMVFQHSSLYPHLTVRENLAFPLLTQGGTSRADIDARVSEIAYGLGLDHQLDRKPATLSGGERQRVATGRALILRGSRLLLMDEPLASLDVAARNGLRAEIRALIRGLRLTTVYVTHDQAEALSLADRIAVLRGGAVEDIGTPVRVYTEPATAFTAAFLGSPRINLAWGRISARNEGRVVIRLSGQELELPAADPRGPALAARPGAPVIVGIRPDALSPAPAPARPAMTVRAAVPGAVLRGRVSALEYYGHEWLARIDAGLAPVDLDSLQPPPPAPAGSRRGRRDRASGQGGGHRGAGLVIRFASPGAWSAGQDVTVAVDLPRLLLFDEQGRRIAPPEQAAPAPELAPEPGTKTAPGSPGPSLTAASPRVAASPPGPSGALAPPGPAGPPGAGDLPWSVAGQDGWVERAGRVEGAADAGEQALLGG